MTSDKAVRTFSKAIEIAQGLPQAATRLVVAGGSYTGNIELLHTIVAVELLGNVTISGYLHLLNSVFYINETNNTFTVSSGSNIAIDIDEKSSFIAYCSCTVSCTGSTNVINVYRNSLFYCLKNLTCSASNLTEYAVNIHDHSYFCIIGDLSFSGSSNSGTIYCIFFSFACFLGDVTVPSGFTGSGSVIAVFNNSFVEFYDGSITLYDNSSNYVIWVDEHSGINFESCPDIKIYLNYAGIAIVSVQIGSAVRFEGSNTNLLLSTNTNPSDFFRIVWNSHVAVNVKTYKCSGTVSYCGAFCSTNSSFSLSTSATVTNSLTGSRYRSTMCSVIDVGGAGANRLPGSTNGYTDTATYGIYS